MKKIFAMLVLSALVAGAVRGAEGDNPFRGAKVGDWARYEGKTVAPSEEGPVETRNAMYVQITAKDEAKATLTRVFLVTADGQTQQREFSAEIDLAKAYDPLAAMLDRAPEDAKVERGAPAPAPAAVPAAGREWNCRVIETKIDNPAMNLKAVIGGWYADDAPLSRLVKMTTTMDLTIDGQEIHNESSMELVAFGDAAKPDPDAPVLGVAAPEDEPETANE